LPQKPAIPQNQSVGKGGRIRVLRDGALHGTREKRANIRCNEAQRSGKYATEDGDVREARDGTPVTKRKRSVSENADSLRRNNEKKRRFRVFSSDKYSFYKSSPQMVNGDARVARDGTSVTKRQRSGLTPFTAD